MNHFIGIDVGSQGVRIVVIDEVGKIVSSAERKWALINLANSEHEQDPNLWWNCICDCLQEVSSTYTYHHPFHFHPKKPDRFISAEV